MRQSIPQRMKLAAALSLLLPEDERTMLRTRRVPAQDVISRFEFHHIIFHAIEPINEWWNLEPMFREDHRKRTQEDIAVIAKTKRIEHRWRDFTARVLGPRKRPKTASNRWGRKRKTKR